MANKYIVTVSYVEFVFDEREAALDFAETAFNACTDEKSVELKIVKGEDDNE